MAFEGVELQMEVAGGTGGALDNQDAVSGGRSGNAGWALPGGGEANSTGGLSGRTPSKVCLTLW